MSGEGSGFEVRVEPERLDSRVIAWITAAGVVTICVCAVAVKLWLPHRLSIESAVHGEPQRIGALEQTLFVSVQTTQRQRSVQEQSLHQYRWVNREKGVVAIPIERAMQLMAEAHR